MNWRHALIVVVALLAITAMPASAQNASAVAFEHTTFGTGSAGEPTPTQTTNMTIEGSGESASVADQFGLNTTDGFEDQNYDEYNLIGSENTEFTTDAKSGSYASEMDFAGDGTHTYLKRGRSNGSVTISGWVSVTTTNNENWVGFQVASGDNNPGGYQVEIGSGGVFRAFDRQESTEVHNTDPGLTEGQYYYLAVSWDPDTGELSGWVDDDTDYTSNPIDTFSYDDSTPSDKQSFGLQTYDASGGRARFDDIHYDSAGKSTGMYIGAAHDAENIHTGFTNLTLQNASADVTWQEDGDGDGVWTNVSSTTYTTSGNVTADLSGRTSDRWRLRVDVTATGGAPVAEIHDEVLLFESTSPTLSDPDPADDIKIQNATSNVSIDLSDTDLPLTQGDNVTVSASDDDGNSLGSTTLTSNGTVSFSYQSEAGENEITWTASDDYGNSDRFVQRFTTPSQLFVRNESAPSQIVNTRSNITATFFGDDGETVVESSSDDGVFNFSGLPADTEYTVTVSADGYRSRQVIITSLFDQQNIYLLPDDADAANIDFVLNDETGRFDPGKTTLFVEMPLRRNNTTEYRTAFADQFGATDTLRVTLRDGTRYRLKVRNGEGEVRELSSYTTSGADTATLTIGQVKVSGEVNDRGVAFDSQIIETDQGRAIRVVYRDPERRTDNIEVEIMHNGSKYTPNLTDSASDGRYIATVPINNSTAANASFDVSYQADRVGGDVSGGEQIGDVGDIGVPLPVLPLSLMSWTATLGAMGMVVIRTPRLAPAAGTVTASGLSIIGWLSVPAPALGIAGAISIFAVLGRGAGQ